MILGFSNVTIYMGGAFEWALLHDIYGATAFKERHDQTILSGFFSSNCIAAFDDDLADK